jgi:carboxylesterase type B
VFFSFFQEKKMKHLSLLLSLLFVLVAAAVCISAVKHGHIVKTSNHGGDDYIRNVTGGLIMGYQSQLYPGVGVWKNVPFGTAPRFQNPVPKQPWSGILNCTQFGPGCSANCDFPQPQVTCSATTSEDCLNLNIYSPDPLSTQGGLPVMFFIPGGRFQFGAGGCPLYASEYLALSQGIVVVTINYRLGALGAMVTQNGIRGNFNLKDQLLALQWTRANIAKFGGNPNDITLGSESAGAMSVSIMLSSPMFSGLFTGAMMSSNPLGIPYQNMDIALKLGANLLKKVGCDGQPNLDAELACLNALPVGQIVNASDDDKVFPWPSTGITPDVVPWGPVVGDIDGFMPMQPMDAAAQGKLNNVPILLGNNANDSLLFIDGISSKPMDGIEVFGVLTAIFGLIDTTHIEFLYPDSTHSDKRIFLSRVMTDYLFSCANRNFAANAQKNQGIQAYFYYYNHLASFSDWLWSVTDPICEGFICHAQDLPFIFNLNNSPYASLSPPWSNSDTQSANMMASIWGSFVRNKNPNITGWTPMSINNYNRFNAQPSNPVVFKDFLKPFCDYFDSIGYNHRGY